MHLSYKALIDSSIQGQPSRGKQIWKLWAHKKKCIFLRLAMKDRILTWEFLQCKGKHGPSMCYLCTTTKENTFHLLVECSYAKEIQKEVESITSEINVWSKASIESCLMAWFRKLKLKELHNIPCLIC